MFVSQRENPQKRVPMSKRNNNNNNNDSCLLCSKLSEFILYRSNYNFSISFWNGSPRVFGVCKIADEVLCSDVVCLRRTKVLPKYFESAVLAAFMSSVEKTALYLHMSGEVICRLNQKEQRSTLGRNFSDARWELALRTYLDVRCLSWLALMPVQGFLRHFCATEPSGRYQSFLFLTTWLVRLSVLRIAVSLDSTEGLVRTLKRLLCLLESFFSEKSFSGHG